jgi:hypothetical protein
VKTQVLHLYQVLARRELIPPQASHLSVACQVEGLGLHFHVMGRQGSCGRAIVISDYLQVGLA